MVVAEELERIEVVVDVKLPEEQVEGVEDERGTE